MSNTDGGSAFPQIETGYDEGAHSYDGNVFSSGGMTLRDYFAAKAMSGWLASWPGDLNQTPTETDLARLSYAIADAMLKERDNAPYA